MHAETRGTSAALLVALGGGTHFGEVFFGARKAGREEARHAVRELAASDCVERRVRRIAEIRSAASVGMDVDKARQQRKPARLDDALPRCRRNLRADLDYHAVFDSDIRNAEIPSRRDDARTTNSHCRSHDSIKLFRRQPSTSSSPS